MVDHPYPNETTHVLPASSVAGYRLIQTKWIGTKEKRRKNIEHWKKKRKVQQWGADRPFKILRRIRATALGFLSYKGN